ncbi:DUF4767 domain-containing protein [Vagococcus fluvialis]|uniref:DUF4767 domain-containing protein n=1 Tax=Vagococcus fluvialis TaxID=2738 RepID=UPI003B59B92F
MKKSNLMMMFLVLFVFTGCKNVTEEKETIETTKSSSVKISKESIENNTTDTTSNPEVKNEWNAGSKKELDDFVIKWGEGNNHKLSSYTPSENLDWYGVEMPKDLLVDTNKIAGAIEGNQFSIAWSEDGKIVNDVDRTLVGVYSNAFNQPYDKKYLYFFTLLPDGTPEVLMSSQSQGNEITNYVYFSPLEDGNLSKGFADIIGYKVKTPVENQANNDNILKDFVSNHFTDELPFEGYILQDNEGVTYYLNEQVPNDKESIKAVIDHATVLSGKIKTEVGTGLPIKVKEPNISEYSLTVVDGEYTQANHTFGRIVQGIE